MKCKCKIKGYEDREACSICKAPNGFCEHTGGEFKEYFPSETYDLYLLRRLLAISHKEKDNIWKYRLEQEKDNKRLQEKISELKEEIRHYKWLEKKLEK